MDTSNNSKRCSKCKQLKGYSLFCKDRSRPDGYSYVCTPCRKAAVDKKARSEQKRKYYQEHRSERIAYRQAHKKENAAHTRLWAQRNPDKANDISRRKRARKRNAAGTHSSADIELLRRTMPNCWWCDKPIEGNQYHVDHRIPLARGGSDAVENLVISCPSCNMSKSDKLPHEWNGRLL